MMSSTSCNLTSLRAGERPFKCESCNYLAANQHEVTRHARQVHNGPKPLSCPYCDYKTADRSNFKKHVELHLNPRQFLCPLCKYAASKKCNLQYHIKSRHSGCNVPVDVSKVKLRIKKPGLEGSEENSDSRTSKLDNSSSVDEDYDMDDGNEDEDVDSSPMNLSIRKSSRPSNDQPVSRDAPDKAQKKSNASSQDKLPKTREKLEPEKKVTRQKKLYKVNENPVGKKLVKETKKEIVAAAGNTENRGKRRAKKLQAEKTSAQDQAKLPEPQKDPVETKNSDQQKPVEERAVTQKVQGKKRPEKGKELQKNESSGKEKKSLNKPRKSVSKTSEKILEEVQQKADSPEKSQKEKAVKRKAVEALDLSTKSTSDTPSKAKRLKAKADEKLKTAPEDNKKTEDATATLQKSSGTTPVKQKKTRNSSRRATRLKLPVDPVKEKTTSVNSPSTEVPEASAKLNKANAATDAAVPEQNTSEKMEVLPSRSPGDAAPSPAEDRPPPTFLKPTSPPPLMLLNQRPKPADTEDDEGIHSSHEGGSDISDSASESSDDSGLHSRSSKMANDPETPTDEIPTPTELKSHMCIFCDRTFPVEVEYRRHLNRHLVNVYYMGGGATGQK